MSAQSLGEYYMNACLVSRTAIRKSCGENYMWGKRSHG